MRESTARVTTAADGETSTHPTCFFKTAGQTRPLKHTRWTLSDRFNHTQCRQCTHFRCWWWRWWRWWWLFYLLRDGVSLALRHAPRLSRLYRLTDEQQDLIRVNPTQYSKKQTIRHVKIALNCSPLKLWQRFPAVKSLLVHRAPPSWSFFNDAPCTALWD